MDFLRGIPDLWRTGGAFRFWTRTRAERLPARHRVVTATERHRMEEL